MTEEKEFEFTKGQRECVDLLKKFKEDKEAKFFILKGFAGSGKSTLVSKAILPMFESIAITATTHKACEAINKHFGYECAITIHSRLKLKLKKEGHKRVLTRSNKDSLEVDLSGVTLIDECSLINDDLLKHILELEKVIFVGDPAQLEKIEEESEVNEISKCFDLDTPYKIELTEVVRQAADNPIIKLSVDIRNSQGRFDFFSIKSSSTVFKTSVSDDQLAESCANAINAYKDARIACYHNYRVVQMNNLVHEKLYGKTEVPFSVGERVMFNEMYELKLDKKKESIDFRNNEECTIMNARFSEEDPDVILVALKNKEGHIYDNIPVHNKPHVIENEVRRLFNKWFKDQDKESLAEAWILKEKYAPLRHCYALTGHKLQGSSIDVCFVDLNDINSIKSDFSFNRAFYVVSTRPREFLILNYRS